MRAEPAAVGEDGEWEGEEFRPLEPGKFSAGGGACRDPPGAPCPSRCSQGGSAPANQGGLAGRCPSNRG
jgi:hypothetical protein